MPARCGVDQLARDAYLIDRSAHAAFKHIADTQFLADLFNIDGLAFVGKAGIAGDYKQGLKRDRAVMMSSTMPSAKYFYSGSPDMF